jgi:hypothetical protein
MLDESSGEDWVSRRNSDVRRPIATIGRLNGGIPCLTPEIQLYYKAKNVRPKDELDFAQMLPMLSAGQREWLRSALATTYGAHVWQRRLAT